MIKDIEKTIHQHLLRLLVMRNARCSLFWLLTGCPKFRDHFGLYSRSYSIVPDSFWLPGKKPQNFRFWKLHFLTNASSNDFGIISNVHFVSMHRLSINTLCVWRQNHSFSPLSFYCGYHLCACCIQCYQMCEYSLGLMLGSRCNQVSCFDNSSLTQRGAGSILTSIHGSHSEWNLPGAATGDSNAAAKLATFAAWRVTSSAVRFWYTDLHLDSM